MDEVRDNERQAEFLRSANEVKDQELSLAQKNAAIREAKAMYGVDWKKHIGGAIKYVGKNLKVDKEALHTMHSMGMGGEELRNMSNPAMLRRHK